MPTKAFNKHTGLETFFNQVLNGDDCSQSLASNVIIDRDNILEPRRGLKVLSEIPEYSKQLLTYKDRVLVHYGNSIGYFDNNEPGNLTTYKNSANFVISGSTTHVVVVDHGLSTGEKLFFSQTRDYSSPGTIYFSLPSGIDTITEYEVYSIIDKDTFQVSLSSGSTPITLGSGRATVVFDFIINEVKASLRIKNIELNSNLYVTAADGIKKFSALSPYSATRAGGISALNCDLFLDLSSSSGFLGPQTDIPNVEVAYRIVWGTKDINKTLVLGPASERSVIQNFTGQDADVKVRFPVPNEVTVDYFYQIYRTDVFTINASGDEMRLVLEAAYDGYSTVIDVIDSTPEVIRDSGSPLYSNEFTGEGALQINTRPPVSEDIAIFKNRAWYANTKTSHKLDSTFLGFDGILSAITAPVTTGTTSSLTITLGSGHGVVVGEYIALANTTGIDGQYIVTATSSTTVTVAANSTLFGSGVVYRSYITITKDVEINRYFFVGRPQVTTLVTKAFASVNSSDYVNLTNIDDEIKYYFWFAKSNVDADPLVAGRIGFKVDLYTNPVVTDSEVAAKLKEVIDSTGSFFVETSATPGELIIATITSGKVTDVASATQFGTSLVSISTTQIGFGENASLGFIRLSGYVSPATAIEDTGKSIVRVINSTFSSPVYAYYLASLDSLPGQFYLEEKNFSTSGFKIEASKIELGQMFNPVLISGGVSSTNNIGNNILMYSKELQAEAVPAVNSFSIGPRDKAIKRILGLRNSLFILKEEGIYRLTGETPTNFNISMFDNSGTIISADSAVILNNQIYVLTTQGIGRISETGFEIVSRKIENIFNRISSDNYPFFEAATFAVTYEADRSYLIFTVNDPSDEVATIGYRYNTFTQTWTTINKSPTCGVVNSNNKLYLGASDETAVEVERKKIDSRDYADRQYDRVISAYQQERAYVDSALLMEAGDVLSQKQYLTIDDFNKLIKKLKLDPQLGFDSSFSLMSQTGGADFSDSMRDLTIELNSDDSERISNSFNLLTDVNLSTDVININAHGWSNDDILKFTTSGTPPLGITDGGYYRVVNALTNSLQLTNLEPNVLAQASAYGIGTLTSGGRTLLFNLVRDVDFENSRIVFTEHNLQENDTFIFTTSGTPPTGLVSGRSYRAINVLPNSFQVLEITINLQANSASGTGTLEEVYYYSGTIETIKLQREFNDIINSLNSSDGTFFSNYTLSSAFEELDLYIKSVNFSQNYVTLEYDAAFYIGEITHYKAIKSEAVYNVFTLGEPATLKHVRGATTMVENNSLNKLTIGYASDLSGDFENVTFTLDGSGLYGKGKFGEVAFGGDGTSYPLRTLIPRQKQRCRHIKVRIFHNSAFFKFSILGLSFDYESTSERTSRK